MYLLMLLVSLLVPLRHRLKSFAARVFSSDAVASVGHDLKHKERFGRQECRVVMEGWDGAVCMCFLGASFIRMLVTESLFKRSTDGHLQG